MKWCSNCKIYEPVSKFSCDRQRKSGFTNSCIASRLARWQDRCNNNLYRLAKYRVSTCSDNAAIKGVSVDKAYMLRWWFERLQDAKHGLLNCEFCGIRLRIYDQGGARSTNKPDALSCDCLLPDVGYERGNVAHVCYRCNGRKSDSTIDWMFRVLSRALNAYANSIPWYAALLKQAPNNNEALPCNTIKLPLILPVSASTS